MAGLGKVLNIEVGDRLTKVCLSLPRGKSVQIKTSFLFQTPENSVSDGVINAPEALAERLTAELNTRKLLDARNVVFTLTSGKVATREVMLPPVKESRLKSVVEANAGEYFPVDLSRYHIAYSLLEKITGGENPGNRVLVLAVPLAVLEGYYKLAALARLTIQAIDFSGNSQYQALRGVNGDHGTMFVNVDCNHSLVSFLQGPRLLLQRAFTFGGDELVLGYMNAATMKSGDYVQALGACSVPEERFFEAGILSEAAVQDSLARLIGGVARSIDFFNTNYWNVPVERIVLMGPCSHIVRLRDAVQNATGLETIFLDDMPLVSALTNSVESASCYIACIGSNLSPLDLMPPQLKTDKKAKQARGDKNVSLLPGIIICVVCLAGAAALSLFATAQYRQALREKEAAEQEIASLQAAQALFDDYVRFQAGAEALQTFDASIDSPNDELTAFIEELEKKMPADLLLLSATCTREGVTMNVTAPTFEAAAMALVKLRGFESLREVKVSSIVEQPDVTGTSYVSFSLQCAYGQNPYLSGLDPYTGLPVSPQS